MPVRPLIPRNNLSDLIDKAVARTNLGLGASSSPTFAGLTLNGALNGLTLNARNSGLNATIYNDASKVRVNNGSDIFWVDSNGYASVPAAGEYQFNGRGRIRSPSDGAFNFLNNAANGWAAVQCGNLSVEGTVQTVGDIFPNTDGLYDIGRATPSANRYRDLRLSRDAYIAGKMYLGGSSVYAETSNGQFIIRPELRVYNAVGNGFGPVYASDVNPSGTVNVAANQAIVFAADGYIKQGSVNILVTGSEISYWGTKGTSGHHTFRSGDAVSGTEKMRIASTGVNIFDGLTISGSAVIGASLTASATGSFGGNVTVGNGATNPLLYFGGATAAFPMLRRNSSTLEAKLADNSGYTVIDAGLMRSLGSGGGLALVNRSDLSTLWYQYVSGNIYRNGLGAGSDKWTLDSSGNTVQTGAATLASLGDTSAPANSWYFSTTAGKPVYQDSSGVVHALY